MLPSRVVLCLSTLLLIASSREAGGQTFWLSREFLGRVEQESLLKFPLSVRFGPSDAVGPVHTVANDCELHVAGNAPPGLFNPRATVAEPPNVCQFEIPNNGGNQWRAHFRSNMANRSCEVTGFLRLYAEHWPPPHGATNPRHMVEIHPALEFDCAGGNTLELNEQLRVFRGMSQILGSSLERCYDQLTLEIRSQTNTTGKRGYQVRFNHPKSCGNFAIVRAVFPRSAIEQIDNGHVVDAEAFACGSDVGHQARFFTYDGTSADSVVSAIRTGATPVRGMRLHAMLSYDWGTILDAVKTDAGNFRQISNWQALDQLLAFAVFDETTETCRE